MATNRRANYFSRINVLTDAGPADQIIQALAEEVLFQNDLILRQSRRRDIYDRMRHRQDEIASAYDSLVDPIAGAPAKIIPAHNDKSSDGREQAEHLTSLIADSQGYREIISGILEIPWRGYGGVELTGSRGLGEPLVGEARVAGAVEIPPESLVFDVLGNPRLRLRGVSDVNGIDLLDPSIRWRFIVAQWGSTKGGNWFGTGIALRVYWLWWFLTQNLKDWNKALEKFAMPVLLAAVKGRDWATLRTRMLTLFKDYVADSGIVYPEDQVEIDALNQTGRFPAYEKMDEMLRRSIRKAILGETLTADQGSVGSQALGEVHASTLTQRQRKIVAWAQDVLSSTLVCYLSEAEFGRPTGHRLEIEFEEAENPEITLQQLTLATDLKLPADRSEIYQKLNLKEVTDSTDPKTVITLTSASNTPMPPGMGGDGAPQPVPDGGGEGEPVEAPAPLDAEPFQEAGGLVDGRNENRRLADEDGLVVGTSVRAARQAIKALTETLPERIRDAAKKKKGLVGVKARDILGSLDLREITETLTTGMLSADLLGRQHVLQHAKRRNVVVDPDDANRTSGDAPEPEKFQAGGLQGLTRTGRFLPSEAIAFFRNSLRLPMRTIESLVDKAGIRSQAATKVLLDQLREFIDGELLDALKQGTSVDQFTRNVQSMLERAGLDPANPFRLETIFRTNMKTFATAGRLSQLEHPDVRETFQWLQYNAVLDGATRPDHAAMNGKVFRADDPVWDTWMPPNGFNCRCSVTPVSQEDIQEERLSVSRVAPKVGGNRARPDKGFRRNNAQALRRNPTTGIA